VLLRLAVGWHFYKEGAQKIHDSKFSSTGFLSAAKGPFAPSFHSMIYDADGLYRLDAESTIAEWEAFRDNAAAHFGFDEKQQQRADALVKSYSAQLKSYLASQGDEIQEYYKKLERRDKYKGTAHDEDPSKAAGYEAYNEVPSLRGQLASIEAEIKKQRDGWLRTIDSMWANYERDVNALATPEQGRGDYRLLRVGRRSLDSVTVDRYLPYFDLIIGVLLILGLFTRVASCAAAAFLLSVILTQWPWAVDAAPTFNQTVEFCSLLVLAGTAAGRFAGLDFFIHLARLNCCRPKQETPHATHA
jgi:uncharacterized membrane protein YphA (DoxX/SURF4 family)